uniref:Cytochrome P450 n=2 Tax=Tetranychus urticae TaxID=32264 RepID=T1KC29_TETUR
MKVDNEGVFVFWLGWYPMVAITDYKGAEAVLSKPNQKKGEEYKFLGLQDGIVASHGQKWRARRRMIDPFFNAKSLTSYIPLMNQAFSLVTKDLKEEKVETIDMAHNIHIGSLNVIMESTMSIPVDSMKDYKKVILSDLESVEKIALTRILNPILWFDKIFFQTKGGKFFKEAVDRFDAVLIDKITERLDSRKLKVDEKEQKMRHDLIDLLAVHHDPNSNDVTQSIDIEGMKAEIVNVIIAGHDSIAAGIRWTLFLLGNHIECQEILYNEIATSFADDQYPTTLDEINRLTYLDQCVKESMRLYPPIPLTSYQLEYDAEVGKYVVPKGTAVAFSFYTIHRDEKIWENPNQFDPDRFSPERYSKIPRYGYIPFGLGKRSCVGQKFAMIEMKVFIIHLIKHYSWISTKNVDEVKFAMDVSTKPLEPLNIKLTPRN